MLRRLRLKFICINMVIVTIMLAVIFGLVLHFTSWNMEQESVRIMQAIAMDPFRTGRPGERSDAIGLPYFMLQIDHKGNLKIIGEEYYDLSDEEYILELINIVSSSGKQTGILKEYDLRFCRVVTPDSQRLVFVDMSVEQSVLYGMLKSFAFIGGISFVAFLLISLLLARWAVRPVAKAWSQQRQFVADASHELKTPLTVILTNAELLNDPDYEKAARQQSAQSILTMSGRMRELVEQLLDLARIDSGTAQADIAKVDISKLVSDAVLPFEPLFFEKNVELTCQVEGGLTVKGSETHLRQVVDILLDNAQKYAASPGSASVTLCRQGKNHCLLSVADRGEPISKEDLKNVFKRFYRADKARTMSHSYGLGLSIASGIVEAHHGKIWAESIDETNTFYVKLPLRSVYKELHADHETGAADNKLRLNTKHRESAGYSACFVVRGFQRGLPLGTRLFVCREASVIHEDILGGDAFVHGLQLHGLDLVVVLLAVVAAHEQFRSCTGLVQFNASAKPIRQHIAGASAIMDIAAQHKDAVNIRQCGSLFRGKDLVCGAFLHMSIDAQDGDTAD